MSRQDSLTRHREKGGCLMLREQSSSRSPGPVAGPSRRMATRERAAKTKANAALKQYKIDYAEMLPLEMSSSQSESSSYSLSPSPSPPLLTPPLSPPSAAGPRVWSPKKTTANIDDYTSPSGSWLDSIPSTGTPLLFSDDSQPSETSSLFYDYHDSALSDLTEELLSGSLSLGFQDMSGFSYPGLDLSAEDQPLAPFDFTGSSFHLPPPDMPYDLGPGYDPSRAPDLSFCGYLQTAGRLDEFPGEWNQ